MGTTVFYYNDTYYNIQNFHTKTYIYYSVGEMATFIIL